MAIKSQTIYATGMNRDSLIGTGSSSKFVYENMNLRFVTTEDSTTGSWVTEKGTKLEFDGTSEENLHILEGFEPIGQAVINDQWVLFGIKNNQDKILKLYYNGDTLTCDILYTGNLNFNQDHHIETTTFFEDEQIQKVYWVDGINPLRVINIMNVKASSNLDTQFDALPTLALNEDVTIEKEYDGNGMFPSGTTQYFFTYINKYGQESNIFYASPLYYNTRSDRGLNPDGSEFSSNSYVITINNIDYQHKFDYLRIYSLNRPAENATPYAKIVVDWKLNSNEPTIIFKDTNTTGETFDYTALMYLGGRDVIPSTIESKNNTLFLANLNLPKQSLSTRLQNILRIEGNLEFINESRNSEIVPLNFTTNEYPYRPQLKCNSFEVTTFKHDDYYRVGIQFMDYKGIWSEVIYLKDIKNELYNSDNTRVVLKYTFPNIVLNNISAELSKFKKARLVCCYPDADDRDVIAQGVLCPTMYHPAWEKVHAPDRFSSWFFRPTKNGAPVARPQVQHVEGISDAIVDGDVGLKFHIQYNHLNWVALSNAVTSEDSTAIVTAAQNILNIELIPKVGSSLDINGINIYTVAYDHIEKTVNSLTVNGVQAILKVTRNEIEDDIASSRFTQTAIIKFEYYQDQWNKIKVSGINNHQITFSPNGSSEYATYSNGIITYQGNNSNYIEINNDFNINNGDVVYTLNSYDYYLYISHKLEDMSHGSTVSYESFLKLFDYHPTVRPISLGQAIEGVTESYYTYYDGECAGGWGWDTNNRVSNEVQSADVVDNDASGEVDWGFYVDTENYYTFHSPDIEFNETLRNFNLDDYYVRIIGQVNQTSWRTEVDIDASTAVDYNGNKGYGLLLPKDVTGKESFSINAYDSDVYNPYAYWEDLNVYASNRVYHNDKYKQIDYFKYKYFVYPFHRQYLNNYTKDITIDIDVKNAKDPEFTIQSSSDIKSKIFSTNRVFGSTVLYIDANEENASQSTDPAYAKVFDYSFESPIKVKANANNYINYNANINDISEPCRDSNLEITTEIYEYEGLNDHDGGTVIGSNNVESQTVIASYKGSYPVLATKRKNTMFLKSNTSLGNDSAGVQITFKSSTHAILNVSTLPKHNTLGVYPSLYLAELYKKNNTNRFGGTSDSAILNSIFYPCGEPVDLTDYLTNHNSLIAYGTQGDTYYMMYDCLKTCSYGGMNRNQVIEIGSFMCETHINLDGRYDKYRGVTTGLTGVTKENFNHINLGYTQNKGLFSYHTIDKDLIDLNNFPNQITWTKTKSPGEIVDVWTNITLVNTADADGTVGAITNLSIFNDKLLLFQEHGIAQVGYNEKTAISTENGIPLELANSEKYTGLGYLSREIGCQNKWSINISKNGVMFIDSSRKELNIVSDTIVPLSTKNGFDSFFIEQLDDTTTDFVTYYDKNSKDIYYINNNYCLAFNEVTGTFTSFYSYEGVPYMCNISNHSLLFKNNKVWAAREGNEYCKFYDEEYRRPYWVTIVSDGNELFQADKVFNIVETRSDVFNPNGDGLLITEDPFDTIAAWNSYQKYKEFSLDGTDPLYEWKAVRRFNIWRYIIPRATYNDTTMRFDRIRNPFTFIKLLKKEPNGNRAILHDTVVYFDVK